MPCLAAVLIMVSYNMSGWKTFVALAKNPKILLCDEPTGALDYNTGKQILKLLQDTSRESGMTIVVITHNAALAPMADRIITVKSGRVVKNEVNENPVSVEEIDW